MWRAHGALDYKECVGDDLKVKMGMPFPRGIRSKSGETVVFAYIVYKSRAHRDRVNAKVMKDKRMKMPKSMPFDVKRMIWGGGVALRLPPQSKKSPRKDVLTGFARSSCH
jgi:uncharacterized protein YbaA (DUF1428 family)